MVLDGGPCANGIESTIIGFEEEEAVLYRLGAISKEEIET
jgi:L-threonylcarbamoyladenylate synthase